MNARRLFLAGCLLAALNAHTALASGYLAYYPFEGNASDATGNGWNGTVSGATLTTGHAGQGYLFDGVNDFIGIPLNINPSAYPTLTMGAWVKPSATNPIRQIISHDNGSYDRSLGIDWRGGGTGYSAFSGSGGVVGSYPATAHQWSFVAIVYEQLAQRVSLYVDGNMKSGTGTLGSGWSTTSIGRNPSHGEYFSGTIDDVFFTDTALARSQLDQIMVAIPEPASFLLLGSGMIVLGALRKKGAPTRRRRVSPGSARRIPPDAG